MQAVGHGCFIDYSLLSAVPFLMLHIKMSIAYKSSGILKVLCNVRPLVNNVGAIPLDAVANAMLPLKCSFAKLKMSYLYHLEHHAPLITINHRK